MRIRTLAVMLLCMSAAPFSQSHGATAVELDIPFVTGGDNEQRLDLYLPELHDFPTILFVHEGGLTSGDRKDEPYAHMCETFQSLGIACAATNYRLAPASKWPAQPDDVVSALRWLKENIAARGGNPQRIFLFGHSSGCLLVSIVAADAQYLKEHGLRQKDIAGVISMGCRLNDTVVVAEHAPSPYESSWVPPDRVGEFMASEPAFVSLEQRNTAVPAAYVSKELPPMLILIAEDERFFPPVLRDAAEFVGRAQERDGDANIAIMANRNHMSAIRMMVTADDPTVQRVVAFVSAH